MKRALRIGISGIIWAAIIFYMVWASRLGERNRAALRVERLAVSVSDSAQLEIITAEMVSKWILDASLCRTGESLESIDTRAITDFVAAHDFVKTVKTFVDMEGTVNVVLTQRMPAMRFITETGYNFYVTEDGFVIPITGKSAHYVPVVTGTFGLPFDKKFNGRLDEWGNDEEKKSDKNYIFLSKLINFVNYIRHDIFWNSQIVQINVLESPERNIGREPEIELVPRVGDQIILLGQLEGYSSKLDRLLAFYNGALGREGWNNWNYLNLKYDNQVVCSNK